MKSMTGYGRGEWAQDGRKITVEISSVNRRQGDIAVYLPRELEALEPQVRDEINRVIARGRLTARFTLQATEDRVRGNVRLNLALAREYARHFRQLSEELKLSEPLTLDTLTRAPGVLQSDEDAGDAGHYWPMIQKALRQALSALASMREREGGHLTKDLCGRIAALQKAAARIQRRAPQVVKRFRQQLRQRLQEAGLPESLQTEDRLLQEIVVFADRSDISEELTRLDSHFQQFHGSLKAKEPVGRMLDFLAQEIYREVNTIGSKANDSLISREIVVMKAELEKFREQVQNIE